MIVVPESMDLWEDQVLAHVRTKRHGDWWERQQVLDEAVPILDVAISPGGLLSPIAIVPPAWTRRGVPAGGRAA